MKIKDLIDEFHANNIPIAAIALQEIWKILVIEDMQIKGFSLYINERKKSQGGGVAFYVLENTNSKVIKSLTFLDEKIFESIGIELTLQGKKHVLLNFYRSPNPPKNIPMPNAYEIFFEHLHSVLSKINETNQPCYVFSDSNINLLKLNHDIHAETFFNTISLNGFMQLIFKATRVQGPSYGLIDHILTNAQPEYFSSGVIISDISDHFLTFVVSNAKIESKKDEFRSYRNFSLRQIARFKEALQQVDWYSVTSQNDVNISYANFWTNFSNLYEQFFPLKKVKKNKNLHPQNKFITQGLLISRTTKNNLHKAAIINPNEATVAYYRTYRNIYNSLVRKSRTLYYSESIHNNQKNPKKVWEVIKETLNKQNSDNHIPEILQNQKNLTDNMDKANAFNTFFTNIGLEIHNTVPPSSKNFADYLPLHPNPPTLEFNEIGPIHVSDIIKSLPNKSSQDLNGISLKLVKSVRTEISTPLAHIFNLSLTNGVFPESLKCSRTVPVYKSGQKNSCDNYRPISLVPTFSKILEKIVAIKLSNHLDINKLLYKHQYGFQRGKQTEHNLLHLINFVGNALNENKYCIGIFLDIKKAFDCVPRNILFQKLKNFGIRDNKLNWFISYLSNRKQICDVNGSLSDTSNVDIGVLQGSTLGPILFLCFINDLPLSNHLLSLLFADDTACLAAGPELNPLIEHVNCELKKLSSWFRANKLVVNVSKTKYVLFHTKQKRYNIDDCHVFYDNNDTDLPHDPLKITELGRISNLNPIMSERSYKYLGILIDENLSFDHHTSYLAGKISRSLYFISKSKNILPKRTLLNLYYALIHPHFLYCATIYSSINAKNFHKLEILQKKALRLINLAKANSHTKTLFIKDKILPLEKLIQFQKASLMHSIYYEYCPSTLHEIFTKNPAQENLNLREYNNFLIPRPRIEQFKKFPQFSLPTIWNSLNEAKLYNNRTTFQIALKNKFFDEINDP